MWANRWGRSPKMSDVSELLTKNERCERIAQVAHQKWAMWAIRSGHSPKMSNHEQIAQVAHQKWANERIACFFERITHSLIFSQKTSNSLRKPMSEFPALQRTVQNCQVLHLMPKVGWWNVLKIYCILIESRGHHNFVEPSSKVFFSILSLDKMSEICLLLHRMLGPGQCPSVGWSDLSLVSTYTFLSIRYIFKK